MWALQLTEGSEGDQGQAQTTWIGSQRFWDQFGGLRSQTWVIWHGGQELHQRVGQVVLTARAELGGQKRQGWPELSYIHFLEATSGGEDFLKAGDLFSLTWVSSLTKGTSLAQTLTMA